MITFSFPSWTCDKTAPMALASLLQSVSKMNGSEESNRGKANTGACSTALFKFLKEASIAAVTCNGCFSSSGSPFPVTSIQGPATAL